MWGSASSLGATFQRPSPYLCWGKEARRKPLCPRCRGRSRQQPIGLVCVCACASVSRLLGRRVWWGEVGNVSFSNKLNILRREFGDGLLCYSSPPFLSLCVGMRTKPENSLEPQAAPVNQLDSPGRVPQLLCASVSPALQSNPCPVCLERRTHTGAKAG